MIEPIVDIYKCPHCNSVLSSIGWIDELRYPYKPFEFDTRCDECLKNFTVSIKSIEFETTTK